MTPTGEPTPGRRPPRDSQRGRVYAAESGIPDTRLGSLAECESVMRHVVGSDWWAIRFGTRTLAALPRLRPGNGARRAFLRTDTTEATITLPRRYRTTGVVLHELVHWALAAAGELADHGPTFTRVLADATETFAGPRRASALRRSFARHRVRVGREPRVDAAGRVRYGWDERLERARREPVRLVMGGDPPPAPIEGVFVGWARGRLGVRIDREGAVTTVPLHLLCDVEHHP